MMSEVRVRYAPSPTGHLHIGNARTALFNYLFARHAGGKMILRIEDTDQKRNVLNGVESQMKYLEWLGIDWDEGPGRDGDYGPYYQMERLAIYEKYVNELMSKGLAYKCYMTSEELEAEREAQIARGEAPRYSGAHRNLTVEEREAFEAEGRKPSIRIRVPEGVTYKWTDVVKGDVSFESKDFGDWVIVKQDGIPTYNFAVVVDDHLMKISHVLRGDDHIANTPKQMMVYDALGWDYPEFGHMTLIYNDQHKKLSKRDESIIQFIEQYADLGYLPAALFNFISLLGWSPVGEEEIFSKEEFIEMFDAKRLSKSPAVFDQQKLSWINSVYMKKATLDEVVALSLPFLQEAGRLPEAVSVEEADWATNLIALYKEQMTHGAEIVALTDLFFKDEIEYDEEANAVLSGETVPAVLAEFKQQLEAIEDFTPEAIKAATKATQKATGQKGKNLFMPIRVATTGQTHGPELPNAISLIGKERVLKRLTTLLA
ncbi:MULTISPECIES: glutamate--tRNA ligase [Exiguobacterium]|nr:MULTISPECIES: glutamate--tRNA ligase [Exiguobacterium]MCM3280797.1 glutamate--tRNA ligase [Exiguobacterium sp. MER 193]MBQ6459680.1 glutamate--tRNA ligase [Exiguobacterium sp.]MDX5981153.1 glutamate--tRNA ligase [Exiguobacterium profundum]QUP88553.1 glutamate--tRNA ligase [Exiguobacterium sp. PFWT01]WED56709.1 glutamate--tRNA ligase [Exiguobacterium profundum]